MIDLRSDTVTKPTPEMRQAMAEARAAAAKLAERGVRVNVNDHGYLRAVFHRDITDAGLEQAIEAFKKVLAG